MHGTLDHTTWTIARVTDLRRMIEEKCSASQAAIHLGITRNAAIGKATRLGLNFNSPSVRNFYWRTQTERPKPSEPVIRIRKRVAPKVKPMPQMLPEPEARNLTFADLEKNDCRYAVTADHPMLFCGQTKADGSSYCDHHHHVCWMPPQARNRDPRPR
jgi:GcrA cell cycle regulator